MVVTTVSHYRILEKLGGGGTSQFFPKGKNTITEGIALGQQTTTRT
jgi:hypothetical protein